ncbi:MAG: 30S ribosomal protein S6 [Patescibacteria group bacterium]
MTEDKKNYEISFLTVADEDINEVAKIISKHGASIIDEVKTSKIKLAYPIKRENFANFSYLCFSAATDVIKKINNDLKLNSKVLRFLIITPPVVKSVISQKERRRITEPMITGKEEKSEHRKSESKPAPALSNEELEKKLEEILK